MIGNRISFDKQFVTKNLHEYIFFTEKLAKSLNVRL